MNSRQWSVKFVLGIILVVLLFSASIFAMPNYDTASHVENFFNENKNFIKILTCIVILIVGGVRI